MKWFAAFVLVIACSGIGYCATLGSEDDSKEQKCNDVLCSNKNSVDFKSIGISAKPVEGKYVCISFKGDVTDLMPTPASGAGLGAVNVNFDEQCALKYQGDKDLCELINAVLNDKEKIKDCDVHDADNGAYQFSASLPVAAILFLGLYLLQ